MPKYLIQANYVGDGVKGLIKEGGSARRAAAEKAVKSVGGSLDAMYFAFGDVDVFAIVDMPNHASMTAAALTINASGGVSIRTTVLMSPAEVDEAVKMHPSYRAPGQ